MRLMVLAEIREGSRSSLYRVLGNPNNRRKELVCNNEIEILKYPPFLSDLNP